jgi:hypothetical protein
VITRISKSKPALLTNNTLHFIKLVDILVKRVGFVLN